ncbi:MAG: GatB/YqeY domain-containing protein [Dehalococcoidia bacterium]|nr:GatB/YqeY domain-containing protein [Dehalococcoidia bacterium]
MTNDTTLLETIRTHMKQAWKSGDNDRRDTLRLVIASVDYARIANKEELNDSQVMQVIQKEAKQRKESIDEFIKGNRPDLVAKEELELSIISEYLPDELTEIELTQIIKEVILETNAVNMNDVGLVMKTLMPKLGGRADGKQANILVRELLS